MRKIPLVFAGVVALAGCAQMPPPSTAPSASGLANQSAQQAAATAHLAENRVAAQAAQRQAVEHQFCGEWQKSLDLARRDAVGCAQTTGANQAACWQAVSQWAEQESHYYGALGTFLGPSPYAASAQDAASFFVLTQSWSLVCQQGSDACLKAPQRANMDAKKLAVNHFCGSS